MGRADHGRRRRDPAAATYFPKIQAVLRKYDVLFVADEVICGFWRTGNYWGSQTLDIEPDILVCAKALSSSYLPISAVLVNERVFQGHRRGKPQDRHLRPWLHLFRPSGARRRRDRDAEDLRRDGYRRACPRRSARICRTSCAAASPTIRWSGEVRGTGLIAAVELVADKAKHENFDPAAKVGVRADQARRAERRDRPHDDQ